METQKSTRLESDSQRGNVWIRGIETNVKAQESSKVFPRLVTGKKGVVKKRTLNLRSGLGIDLSNI